jgi:hypothetical protein
LTADGIEGRISRRLWTISNNADDLQEPLDPPGFRRAWSAVRHLRSSNGVAKRSTTPDNVATGQAALPSTKNLQVHNYLAKYYQM